MDFFTPSVQTRQQIADALVRDEMWGRVKAEAWADNTAEAADEIVEWDRRTFTPAQAQVVYALTDHELALEWRDMGFDPDITVSYVEAGIGLDEARMFEADDERPDEATRQVMAGFRETEIRAAIREFKAELRENSESPEDD